MTFEEERSNIYSAIELSKAFRNKFLIVKINNSNLNELIVDLSENGYTVYVNLVCYLDGRSSITISWE
jgi:hypothetical protein